MGGVNKQKMIDYKMQNEWEAAFCQLRSISQSFVANLHILPRLVCPSVSPYPTCVSSKLCEFIRSPS